MTVAEAGLLPRITILTANAGGGHRAAANSLSEALEGRAGVTYLSLMDDHAPFPINTWSAIYGPWVNYSPWLYQLVYRYGASRDRVLMTERAVYPLIRPWVEKGMLSVNPDLFISVHPLHTDVPIWILQEAKRRVPFVTVVTDPVTPPVAWFCPDVDLCIVATEEARSVALGCGMAPHKVRVIGLPIRPAFQQARGQPKTEMRRRLGLTPERPLVLLTGGGAGIGRLRPLAQAIARGLTNHPAHPQLAIIAGRNRELQLSLRAERWPIPVRVLGFVNNMPEWLAATDLLVSKAGPATIAEAACMGVPLIITDYVPGQEAGNVEWVQRHNVGLFEPSRQGLAHVVAELLQPGNPELARMAERALATARPDATREIADAALSLLL
ncbi:MAG: Processive diacylglycerol beta-glucosyltransferase [Chloroflexi bacterium ADurb.Bin325]|nr:MAG: Processive diacylglycerol beta-glucosyltransferase [Chloroflexi bacterium ADurb.Bin325]